MRRDIIVFPFHGIPFFNFNCRRRKFHVFHGHMHDQRRVGVGDRALGGAGRSSARLNSLRSRLGCRRGAPIHVRGGKVGALASQKKTGKEEDDPPNDQHPEREGLDRNESATLLLPNGGVQLLHILLFSVIDPLTVALQGGLVHTEKPRGPDVRSPWSGLGTRVNACAARWHYLFSEFWRVFACSR